MLRPPPRPTLFPTRRSSDLRSSREPRPDELRGVEGRHHWPDESAGTRARIPRRAGQRSCSRVRSEEHTSELQSHHDLVCRLLLEKKKKKTCNTKSKTANFHA